MITAEHTTHVSKRVDQQPAYIVYNIYNAVCSLYNDLFIPTSVCTSEGLSEIRSSQVANPSSEILNAEETERGAPPSSKDVRKSLPAP